MGVIILKKFLYFKGNRQGVVNRIESFLFILLFITSLITHLSANESETIYLNQEEKEWLSKLKKPLQVGITLIPNQVLVSENGTFKGFSIDLFHIIEKKLGLKFEYVYFNTWSELTQSAQEQKIDIIFSVQKTPSRLNYLDFTDTVLKQQNNIIVNIQSNEYSSIETLFHRKVVVTKGSAIEEFVKYNYPEIILVSAKNELEGLKMLSHGVVSAAISGSVRASYYIEKYNLNNLRITDDLEYDYHLSVGSLRTRPFLNVILSKTVTSIPKKQIEALQLKWGYTKDRVVFFDTQTLIYISIVFGIIFPFSLYLYMINRKLQKEITKRKKVIKELQLMRKSRLTQMSEIIGMIAHQWKQPLNNLSLVNQLLLSKYKRGRLNDTIVDNFKENSKKQIDLMLSTIDDFRNFFKVEQVKVEFDLKDTINHIMDVTKPEFIKNNIILKCHSDLNEQYRFMGYSNALIQVLLNIVNNAKDALVENEMKEKKIDISLKRVDKDVLITIQDNAGGIPEEIVGKIFDPYFSTKKKKNGTGLGLYMSKTIVEEYMDGKIEVENRDGGASFNIYIKGN